MRFVTQRKACSKSSNKSSMSSIPSERRTKVSDMPSRRRSSSDMLACEVSLGKQASDSRSAWSWMPHLLTDRRRKRVVTMSHVISLAACLAIILSSVFADTRVVTEVAAAEAEVEIESAFVDTLLVTVKGIRAGKGNLRVGVFGEAQREEFPEGQYLYSAEVPAAEEQITVVIADAVPGEYAIAVIQDLNENGKLDRNIFTKPKEPYGFSGAWKSGGASYEEALIDTEKVGFAITIKLK